MEVSACHRTPRFPPRHHVDVKEWSLYAASLHHVSANSSSVLKPDLVGKRSSDSDNSSGQPVGRGSRMILGIDSRALDNFFTCTVKVPV